MSQLADLCVVGETPGLLLGKDGLAVDEHLELAFVAGLDLRLVLRLGVQLGRETRGPFVVAVSDRAVEDPHLRHAENLPTLRKPLRKGPFLPGSASGSDEQQPASIGSSAGSPAPNTHPRRLALRSRASQIVLNCSKGCRQLWQ